VRQIANKSDGIGQDDLAAIGQAQTTGQGVQSGEQLVGCVGSGASQRIEQGRLPGICIANQRDRKGFPAAARPPTGTTLTLELVKACTQLPRLGVEHSAIELNLLLAWTATLPNATALPFEVSPAANQATELVFDTGEFDLQLALITASALRENVEDQFGSIDDWNPQQLVQITLLHRRQGIIENDSADACILDNRRDFLGLASSDRKRRVRTITPADQPFDRQVTGGGRKRMQLVQ